MSESPDPFQKLFGGALNKYLREDKIKEGLASVMTTIKSKLINCDTMKKILEAYPELTNESLTKQINSVKKDHPDVQELIDKYLKSYQTTHEDKVVYDIRGFVQSGHCEQALKDPKVEKYLNKFVESKDFKEKFTKIFKNQV